VSEATEVGQITFKLAGVLHQENGKWQLVRVQDISASAPQEQDAKGGLTPVAPSPKDGAKDAKKSKKK